jgi:hypothetical protein
MLERAREEKRQKEEEAKQQAEREEQERIEKNMSPQQRRQLQQGYKPDSKVPWRERVPPPRPDFAEDPLTALASEHTGNYPGPIDRRKLPPNAGPAAVKESCRNCAQTRCLTLTFRARLKLLASVSVALTGTISATSLIGPLLRCTSMNWQLHRNH